MDTMSSGNTDTGFSLIELMIVLVVIAVTLSVGSPLFQDLLHSNRLRAETARFLGAINLARSEAVRRNIPVSICASEMAVTGEASCTGK
jgi:type IV fimbrial biogenesis protein FimT